MQKEGKKRRPFIQMNNNPTTATDPVPDLPISIIADIISWLPLEDVARCKCVCKSWYNLSKEPHFTHLHFTRSSSQQRTNIHILLSEALDFSLINTGGGLYLISNGEEDRKWNTTNISPQPAFAGFLVASCNGLLCINTHESNSEGPNLVYNPLARDAIALPKLDFHPNYERGHGYHCGFGFDPTSKKHKVVLAYKRMCYADSTNTCFTLRMTGAIITLGETSWRTFQFPDDLEMNILNTDPLFFSGAFHWVIGKEFHGEYHGKDETRLEGILPMDITTENFQIIKFPQPIEIPDPCLDQTQLENSIIFSRTVETNIGYIGHFLLDIWQIQGAKPGGSCLYKHWTSIVPGEGCPLINDLMEFRLLGVLANGVHLFQAQQMCIIGPWDNRLVLYNAKKHKSSVIRISGAPNSFNARIFQPSFISPTL